MAKKVTQIRYYTDGSNNNYPNNVTYRNLVSGTIFNEYRPIVQLGIQALPGTKFYLNGNNMPIVIGNTGIYELDL
jgi:hypothetical protein